MAAPGPEATPLQVVCAYMDAVVARDFETANAIDARPGDLGRFGRPMRTRRRAVMNGAEHFSLGGCRCGSMVGPLTSAGCHASCAATAGYLLWCGDGRAPCPEEDRGLPVRWERDQHRDPSAGSNG